MNLKSALLTACVVTGLTAAAQAQFVDSFNSIDPAWIVDRYAPAGFSSVVFDGDNRLRLTLDATGSTASRPLAYSSAFYNTQGYQRAGGIVGAWSLEAQVFASAAFNTTTGPLVSTDLWGHSGTTPDGGAYMRLGFSNTSPTDELNPAAANRAFRFRALDIRTGSWIDFGLPSGFTFDTWHTLTGTSTGTAFEYRIDGALMLSIPTGLGADLMSAMVQGYNFGEAAGYSVHWDNVSASAVPEPGTYALLAGASALGIAWWKRRRPAS